MASFNKVIIMGNLTRDPQVRYIPSGTAVADIGLAVNRVWFDKQTQQKREEVTFIDVVLWGRQAEVAGEYLSKGRSVLIEGRLQLDTWQDKESGQNRSKMRVVCENMTMVGGRSEGQPSGGGGQGGGFRSGGDAPPVNQESPPASQESPPVDQEYSRAAPADTQLDAPPANISNDDVPF